MGCSSKCLKVKLPLKNEIVKVYGSITIVNKDEISIRKLEDNQTNNKQQNIFGFGGSNCLNWGMNPFGGSNNFGFGFGSFN